MPTHTLMRSYSAPHRFFQSLQNIFATTVIAAERRAANTSNVTQHPEARPIFWRRPDRVSGTPIFLESRPFADESPDARFHENDVPNFRPIVSPESVFEIVPNDECSKASKDQSEDEQPFYERPNKLRETSGPIDVQNYFTIASRAFSQNADRRLAHIEIDAAVGADSPDSHDVPLSAGMSLEKLPAETSLYHICEAQSYEGGAL